MPSNYIVPVGFTLKPVASGHQRLTIGGTAVSLTVPASAIAGVARLETTTIRYRLDGVAPTAAVGTRLLADDWLAFESRTELTGFQGISTGADAFLEVEYYTADFPG